MPNTYALTPTPYGTGQNQWDAFNGPRVDQAIDQDPDHASKTQWASPSVYIGTPPGNHCGVGVGIDRPCDVYRLVQACPFSRVYGKFLISSTVNSPLVGITCGISYKPWTGDSAWYNTGVTGTDASAGGDGIWNIASEASAVVRTVNFIPYSFFTLALLNQQFGLKLRLMSHYGAGTPTIKLFAARIYLVEGTGPKKFVDYQQPTAHEGRRPIE